MESRSKLGLRFGYQDASKAGISTFCAVQQNSALTDPLSGKELSDGRRAVIGEDRLRKGESSGASRLRGGAGASPFSTIARMLGRAWAGIIGSHLKG
jgi:hypothetical protein